MVSRKGKKWEGAGEPGRPSGVPNWDSEGPPHQFACFPSRWQSEGPPPHVCLNPLSRIQGGEFRRPGECVLEALGA